MKTQSPPGNPLSGLAVHAAFAAPVLMTLLLPCAAGAQPTLPPGFQESVVFSGLTNPTAVKFASDGRVFVAEKSGLIKVFDSLTDQTPVRLRRPPHERPQLLGPGAARLRAAPELPGHALRVRALHAGRRGRAARRPAGGPSGARRTAARPRRGRPATVVWWAARLSRLQASGNVMTGAEQVLVEDWCQQYPEPFDRQPVLRRGRGALRERRRRRQLQLRAIGARTATRSTRAAIPRRAWAGRQTPPTAEGGALRSQDLETAGDPVTLDGAILRLDPLTGAALPDNPLVGGDPARRPHHRLRAAQPLPPHGASRHQRGLGR